MKSHLSQQKSDSCLFKHSVAATIVNRILLVLIPCLIIIKANAQADKRLVLADQFFTEGEYFTAAGLYGQFLKPVVKSKGTSNFPLNSKKNTEGKLGANRSRLDVMYRQAESYRLSHYWSEASILYKECFGKDASKYGDALYWDAVCQRSLGNYSAAEESLNCFLQSSSAGSNYKQAAEKEQKTLQFIKAQITRPDTALYHIQKINTAFGEKGIFAPVATSSSQYLITSTQTDSVVAGINPYHNRLFYTSYANGDFQMMEPVVIEGVDVSLNQGAASLSADGNRLYFTQWKKEGGQVMSSIYLSTKNANRWSKPVMLSSLNQPGYSSKQPFCTADGKYLFFASDRKGGQGNFDIWYAPLRADGTAGEPVNAGTGLNTAGNEQAPFYHSASIALVFASDRAPGMGGYDLFVSKGWEKQWQAAQNMGHPVNSSRDDIYFFSSQNGALLNNALFSSDRGSECCLAVYKVSKTDKKRTSTGVILDCKNNNPVAGAEVIMTDRTGRTLRTITGEDGKYSFALTGDMQQGQLSITKDQYNEKTEPITVEKVDETSWHTDIVQNAAVCIEKKFVLKMENVVTVFFDFDKSLLKERGKEQLDSIYNVLMEDTVATIQISGYTDGRGSEKYNKKLSDKRAKACADYLVQKGLVSTRISFESFGACCPLEMELINGRDNPDGRSMNRRALINITKE